MWKGESQDGSNKKTKYAKFPEKRTFLTPRYVRELFPSDLQFRIYIVICSLTSEYGR